MSLQGAFSSAAMSPSPAWESLGSAETPGPLPVWTMTFSSAKPQGLGWPSEPASPADCFFEATQGSWRWGDDLEPTLRQAAQLSVSRPQCGVFCLLRGLVIDSGKDGRRHPVESCAVEEIGGTTSQGKIP